MDPQRWKRLEALFIAALECDPAERAAYLDETCGGDQTLREELASMLSANEHGMALALENRLLSSTHPDKPAQPNLIGTHIGPYRLEQRIGEGGMGTVYLAQRDDDQYKQKVALKLVRPGFQSKQVMARFRMERQVLARLTHPNITQLLDGGIDDAGRPYLVMQYVSGVPITEYCDKHMLPIDERLALFRTVCAAVQHAHRNLVVHRDLKPSNILVTEEGQVKLLDFGIAKLLNPDWEMSVAVTQSQMRLMTPEYAAPEQVKGEAITTATDVYALGVLLYEILSGRRPYQLKNRIQAEVERIICEVSPARPSTAVTVIAPDARAAATPDAVSRARKTGINRLKKMLQGDLDNIVLMALRKEPTRRYNSASQLSEDIDRYRKGLPIRAQKDSMSYRMQKFIRRHRVAAVFSALFVLVLLGFSIATAYQSRLLKNERDTARTEKVRADQVIGLLVSLFETANPAVVPGGDTLRVGEFVKRGVEKTLNEVQHDPSVAIQLKHTLGRMYSAQGQYKEGRQLLADAFDMQEETYGKDDSTTTAYMQDLAIQTYRLGDDSTAQAMFDDLLARNRRIFGPEHPRVAQSLQNVALTTEDQDEKRALLNASLEMRRALLPANHTDIADGLNQMAIYHYQQGSCDLAIELLKESLSILEESLSPTHPNTLAVMGNLGSCMHRVGDVQGAIDLQRDVITRLETIKSDSSVQMSNAWNNLAIYLTNQGSFEQATSAFRNTLDIQRHLLGDSHARVTSTMRNLGLTLGYMAQYNEGIALLEQALAIKAQRTGAANRVSTAYMRSQYALLLLNAGRKQEAAQEGTAAVNLLAELPQISRSQRADIWMSMGLILLENGEWEAATGYVKKALDSRVELLKPDHPKLAQAQCTYGRLLAELGQLEAARTLLQTGLPVYEKWPLASPRGVEAAQRALTFLQADS